MDKRKKIILAVLVALILVVFIAWPKGNNQSIASDSPVDPDDDDTYTPDPVKPKDVIIPDGKSDFPLKQGSKGSLVKQIQEIINFNDSAFGLTNGVYLTTDGNFGPKTAERAIKVFGSPVVTEAMFKTAVQRRNSLIPYGSRMDDNFPLRLGSYGPKTEAINVALGTYKKGDPYGKNFTAKTAAAIKAKTGYQSIDSTNYNNLLNTKLPNYQTVPLI